MERWLWGSAQETARVPFYPGDRGVWSEVNPGVAIPHDVPDVTVFHVDLFTVCADGLSMLIGGMRLIPPDGTTEAKPLPKQQVALTADAPWIPPDVKPRKQSRLKARLGGSTLFLVLDGNPVATFDETATCFVARLIEADGERVAFAEFVRKNPSFESAKSTPTLNKISEIITPYIERGQGAAPRLKVEDLG
jgi:hypothetical protein